jgi:hypothetical protein
MARPLGLGALTAAALGAAALLLGGCATDSPEGSGHPSQVEINHRLIANYCEYTAATWAQIRGCIAHADPVQIKRAQTNPARYARGELASCLSDAGRFCTLGRLGPNNYPPSWKRLLNLRHIQKGKPDPQCGYYENTLRASSDAENGYDACHAEIDLYCSYGAVSRAQLNECQDNVTWGQIKSLNTNAANYARSGGTDQCGADSGPFCRTVQPDYDY